MRSNLPRILRSVRVNLQQRGTDVLLTWKVTTGGAPDPVSGAIIGGVSFCQTQRVKAFLHTVQIATSAVQQFNEFESGDLILDFAPDVVLDGREGLTFTLPNGQVWVAKKIGDALGRTWDATVAGKQILRSVLLRKAT